MLQYGLCKLFETVKADRWNHWTVPCCRFTPRSMSTVVGDTIELEFLYIKQ